MRCDPDHPAPKASNHPVPLRRAARGAAPPADPSSRPRRGPRPSSSPPSAPPNATPFFRKPGTPDGQVVAIVVGSQTWTAPTTSGDVYYTYTSNYNGTNGAYGNYTGIAGPRGHPARLVLGGQLHRRCRSGGLVRPRNDRKSGWFSSRTFVVSGSNASRLRRRRGEELVRLTHRFPRVRNLLLRGMPAASTNPRSSWERRGLWSRPRESNP